MRVVGQTTAPGKSWEITPQKPQIPLLLLFQAIYSTHTHTHRAIAIGWVSEVLFYGPASSTRATNVFFLLLDFPIPSPLSEEYYGEGFLFPYIHTAAINEATRSKVVLY